MKVKVYNLEGQEAGEMQLSDKVFGVKIKPEVVHQVFVAATNNQREPWADTKNRGEVRGGGKKPWQQKGTGRARHGSIRSPIWKGGGVAFGPLTDRNYKTKINKKTKRLVLKMALTDKVQSGAFYVLEDLNFAEAKTKVFAALLKKMPLKQKSFLVLTPGKSETVLLMTRNLPKVKTLRAEDTNILDLMNFQAVVTSRAGATKLEEVFNK